MRPTTRRHFLAQAAAAGGALAVAPHALAQSAADTPYDMCIAKWAGEDPAVDEAQLAAKLVREAFDAVGGMGRFVKKSDVVWLKPNIAWNRTPEQAATTNPYVVKTLIELCFDAGASKVKVGDNTCHNNRQSYAASGIAEAAGAAGADVILLDDSRFREMQVGGEAVKLWPVYPEIIDSDIVINAPIAKHHGLSTATLCMKNYMGVVGGNRGQWHQNITACLRDITAFMKPQICLLDAVRTLVANGPTGGDLGDVRRLNTVAVGTDVIALDAFGAELLGHNPLDIGTVKLGAESGLGTVDYKSLALKEATVS